MSEKLYNFLSEQGDYTKSYEDFQTQFSNTQSVENLYNFMLEKGDYTKSIEDFNTQFFTKNNDVFVDSPKNSKDIVKNLINIDNNTTYEKDAKLKQNILQSYFDAPSIDLAKIEGAKTIDSPMGQAVDFSSIKFGDAATASQDQLKEYFGEEKYNLYKKYQETGDLNIEDIPEGILPAFEEIQNEETKKRVRFLKEEQVRKNKSLIDDSFVEGIRLDEDVRDLYPTDFVEDYAKIEKEAEQYKSKAKIGSGGVSEMGYISDLPEAEKVKTKKELVGKAIKLQNQYLQNVSDVLKI